MTAFTLVESVFGNEITSRMEKEHKDSGALQPSNAAQGPEAKKKSKAKKGFSLRGSAVLAREIRLAQKFPSVALVQADKG